MYVAESSAPPARCFRPGRPAAERGRCRHSPTPMVLAIGQQSFPIHGPKRIRDHPSTQGLHQLPNRCASIDLNFLTIRDLLLRKAGRRRHCHAPAQTRHESGRGSRPRLQAFHRLPKAKMERPSPRLQRAPAWAAGFGKVGSRAPGDHHANTRKTVPMRG